MLVMLGISVSIGELFSTFLVQDFFTSTNFFSPWKDDEKLVTTFLTEHPWQILNIIHIDTDMANFFPHERLDSSAQI